MEPYVELFRDGSTVIVGTQTGRLWALQVERMKSEPTTQEKLLTDWEVIDARRKNVTDIDYKKGDNTIQVVQIVRDHLRRDHWVVGTCDPSHQQWILWANSVVN
jgi:hypothetical protein